MEIGNWDIDDGIILQKSKNRWDRRTDLKGATFINCLATYESDIIKDKNGNITGSKGHFQEMLFYITDNLNLTVKTVEAPWNLELLGNGSWTGDMGFLQRREADVVSSGLGINLQRSNYIDYPIGTTYQPLTLHAAIPKGITPNMWVFIWVFGPYQWMIFVALLVLLVVGLHLINVFCHDKSGRKFGTKRGASKKYQLNSASSGFALVCLYTTQMGSHTKSKLLTSRVLTMTISILTFLFFAYYTTDITSEMTSGAPKIPIRTFEDVVRYGYRVVTYSPYYEHILKSAKPGTAMDSVYNNQFEMMNWTWNPTDLDRDEETLLEGVEDKVGDPKTLVYMPKYMKSFEVVLKVESGACKWRARKSFEAVLKIESDTCKWRARKIFEAVLKFESGICKWRARKSFQAVLKVESR